MNKSGKAVNMDWGEFEIPEKATRLDERSMSRFPSADEMKHFSIAWDTPLLVIERTYYDVNNVVLKFSSSLFMNGSEHAVNYVPSEEGHRSPEHQ
ncbi:hypothetical protein [Streptomyces sp. NPDC008125]|uniref:hypothetical protein n=1 Tax=Streptomyces sp. NPDC008125 TaxID=3364811 RepID=UPI0036EC73DD